jgi:hypothetical protein
MLAFFVIIGFIAGGLVMLVTISLCRMSAMNAEEKFDTLNHIPINESKHN